jgi:hypothetical protein
MESLEHLFNNFDSRQSGIEANDISEIIKKNLVPYFRRKGLPFYDAVSRAYILMAYLTNNYRNAFIKKDYKIIIDKIKEIRINFTYEDFPFPGIYDLFNVHELVLCRILGEVNPKSTTKELLPELPERIRAHQGLFVTLKPPISRAYLDHSSLFFRIEDEVEKEISDSEILSNMSLTLDRIDKNLKSAEESVKRVEKKLEEIEINGCHAGNSGYF